MPTRPRLKSHIRPLRRSPTALQFGLVPSAGLVVEGLTEAEIAVLLHLDGGLDHAQLYAAALASGVTAPRLDQLLEQLRHHCLLVDEPTDRAELNLLPALRHRALQSNADGLALAYGLAEDGLRQLSARGGQFVLVSGRGSLPAAIASLLRGGGIGRVELGAHRGAEIAQRLAARLTPAAHEQREPSAATCSGALPPGEVPDLVILPGTAALAPGLGAPWRRAGIAHLPVVTRGHEVAIGPLVRPDRGPCLDCLDLHRRDRDPAWPALLAQLAPPTLERERAVEAESTLTATAAGLAAMIAHGYLDGQRLPEGISLEVSLPWPWLVHREWIAHPACSCQDPGGPR